MIDWITENARDNNIYLMTAVVVLPLTFLLVLPRIGRAIVQKKNIKILNKEIDRKTQFIILLIIGLMVTFVGNHILDNQRAAVCEDINLEPSCLENVEGLRL